MRSSSRKNFPNALYLLRKQNIISDLRFRIKNMISLFLKEIKAINIIAI